MSNFVADTRIKSSILHEFEKFSSFAYMYRSLSIMSASSIVKEYLLLDESTPLPFSIAHGVLPYGVNDAMNSTDVEPFHWSFNDFIHNTVKNKPSILLPHPWLLLAGTDINREVHEDIDEKEISLLIGSVPSSTNDKILYDSITEKDLKPHYILVKPRGPGFERSIAFWNEKGVKTLTARSYRELYEILVNFRNIILPNFSTIIFFAASIGLNIRLLNDVHSFHYDLCFYDICSPELILQEKNAISRILTLCASTPAIKKESLTTLGIQYFLPPNDLAAKILEFITTTNFSKIYGLRDITHRNKLQNKLHNFLANKGVSFPSLYIDGFRGLIENKFLPLFGGAFGEKNIALYRYPCISEIFEGNYYQVISRHARSSTIQPGFGASI